MTMNNDKEICIKKINTQIIDSSFKIVFIIEIDGNKKELWYETDAEWESYIIKDRCDGAIVSLIYYAMRFDYNIKLECPISEDLYYQLQYHLIPQLHSADNRFAKIKIFHDKLLHPVESNCNAVGMGMSMGVDSFATLYEYNHSEMSELKDYNITHFTYHKVGAHHGNDPAINRLHSLQSLFERDLEKVTNYCKKYNYPLIVVDSNLDEFLKDSFADLPFWASYSFRNTGVILLLQGLFSKFYISSGFNLDEFHVGTVWDIGRCDPFLLPLLSTSRTKLYRSNQDWTRIKKIEFISNFPESYDYLTVCMVDSVNCGVCFKCKPTILALDVLGSLDKYSNSFDIETYKQNNKDNWLKELWEKENTKGFLQEVLNYALENDYPDLVEPNITSINSEKRIVEINGVNIRKFPHIKAKIVRNNMYGKLQVIGTYKDWFCVKTDDGLRGYCYKKLAKEI